MNVLSIVVAIVLALCIYILFAKLLSKFWISVPSEPDLEDLVDVDIHFKCTVCGAQVTMTMAPTGEIPDAPRHCREDMIITTSN